MLRALFEPEKGGQRFRVRLIDFTAAGRAVTQKIKAEHLPRRAAHRLAQRMNRRLEMHRA